jgi:hypothetical protein
MTLLADPIDVEFGQFLERHPAVYDELVRLAREWMAAGHTKCSISLLWERLRWEYGIRGDVDGAVAFNNNYRSRFARLIMWREPDLRGAFDTRQLRSTVEAS